MTLEEYYIEQCRQKMESEFARQRAECDKLGEDINKAMEKHGITTNDTSDSLASDCDTDGIRHAEIGAEAVHEGRVESANRELETEER